MKIKKKSLPWTLRDHPAGGTQISAALHPPHHPRPRLSAHSTPPFCLAASHLPAHSSLLLDSSTFRSWQQITRGFRPRPPLALLAKAPAPLPLCPHSTWQTLPIQEGLWTIHFNPWVCLGKIHQLPQDMVQIYIANMPPDSQQTLQMLGRVREIKKPMVSLNFGQPEPSWGAWFSGSCCCPWPAPYCQSPAGGPTLSGTPKRCPYLRSLQTALGLQPGLPCLGTLSLLPVLSPVVCHPVMTWLTDRASFIQHRECTKKKSAWSQEWWQVRRKYFNWSFWIVASCFSRGNVSGNPK